MKRVNLWALGIILSLASCRPTHWVKQQTDTSTKGSSAKLVLLQKLQAFDLSEDGTKLSSGNDEILCCVHFFAKENNVYVSRYQKFYGPMLFDHQKMEHALGDTFELSRSLLKRG